MLDKVVNSRKFNDRLREAARSCLETEREANFEVFRTIRGEMRYSDVLTGSYMSTRSEDGRQTIDVIDDADWYDKKGDIISTPVSLLHLHYHPDARDPWAEDAEPGDIHVLPSVCDGKEQGDLMALRAERLCKDGDSPLMMVAGIAKKRPLSIDVLTFQETKLPTGYETAVDELREIVTPLEELACFLHSRRVPFTAGNRMVVALLNSCGYRATLLTYRHGRVTNPEVMKEFTPNDLSPWYESFYKKAYGITDPEDI